MYLCVGVSILPLSTILLLDTCIRSVLTIIFFLHFIVNSYPTWQMTGTL
jgi:hypothetical protein